MFEWPTAKRRVSSNLSVCYTIKGINLQFMTFESDTLALTNGVDGGNMTIMVHRFIVIDQSSTTSFTGRGAQTVAMRIWVLAY